MNKRELIKKIIAEAVDVNLREMARMAELFTLADDWENLAAEFEKANAGKRTTGFNRVKTGLSSLSHKNFLTSNDLMQAFGYNSRQAINREFIPALKQAGILIPLRGGEMPKQQVDLGAEDDEWSISDLPSNDLTQAIDKDLAFKKIKVDPKAKRIEITQIKKYKVKIDAELQDKYETLYLIKTKTFTTSVFKFLKPYVENKYSQKVPEGIELQLNRTWNTKDRSITDLFPNQGDFVKYMKENLPKWNVSQQSPLMVYKQFDRTFDQTTRVEWFKKYEKIDNISVDKTPYETTYEVKVTK